MGTYIIRETYERIQRLERMERSLAEIFLDLQDNQLTAAKQKLGDLAADCKNEFFAIEPVLATLEHLAIVEGKQAAADTATAIARRVWFSKTGFHDRIVELRDVFEGRAAPQPATRAPVPERMKAGDFIDKLRALDPR